MISLIRKYLLDDKVIKEYLGNNIFLIDKDARVNPDTYICLLYKPIDGGLVKSYQVDVRIFGNDIMKVMEVEKALIKRMDWIRQNKISNSDTTIYNVELINGGGTVINEGVYETLLFFYIKTN